MSRIESRIAQASMISSMKDQVSFAEWAQPFEDRKASGLPVKSRCRENGISPGTCYCHLREAVNSFSQITGTAPPGHVQSAPLEVLHIWFTAV